MSTPRTQLWKEESAILAAFAAGVPEGGTIVEIGTAEGGTARLMHEAVAGRGVAIHTVDVSPSRIARATLQDTGVHIVAEASEAFAARWPHASGRPIDFLFIDGNHDLEHVVADWNAWAPRLAPGGRVALHDFDPARRGGLAHLAVRVCGDTLLRLGRLRDAGHDYKLLHGRVDDPGQAPITADDCRQTLSGIAGQVRSLLDARPDSMRLDVDARLAALLRVALGTSTATPAPDAPVWIRADGDGPVTPPAGGVALDSLAVCYLAEQALRRDYAGLAELPSSHTEFLVWGEALQMLDHGWSGPRFPAAIPGAAATLGDLSSFVAREQVRLVLLSRLLGLLVDWRP